MTTCFWKRKCWKAWFLIRLWFFWVNTIQTHGIRWHNDEGNTARLLDVVVFARDRLRDRHSGSPFWNSCHVSCKTAWQTNERTRLFFFSFWRRHGTGPSHGSVYRLLCCHTRAFVAQKGQFNMSLVLNKTKNSFLWFWGMSSWFHWRARRSYDHRLTFVDALEL